MLANLTLNNYSIIPDVVLKRFFPKDIVIEPVAGCNIKCLSCPANDLKRRTGMMSFSFFKKILNIINPKSIDLFFMGESFLNPEIFKMISYARKKNIFVKINTNCTTLERDYKKILESGLNTITLSLDGLTQKTTGAYRKGANADKILRGIDKLCYARKNSLSNIQINVRTLVFKDTEKELEDIISYLKDKDINHLYFIKPILDNWGGKKNFDSSNIKPSDKWLRYDKKPPSPCPAVNRLVITWDGNMLPCCHDVNGLYSYGNIITNNSFWSKKGRELREKVVNCKLDICETCQRSTPDKILKIY